jgi:hypothetical protein
MRLTSSAFFSSPLDYLLVALRDADHDRLSVRVRHFLGNRPRYCATRPQRAASRGQQVVDIGLDMRWICIPFGLPVAVDLPIWTRKLAIVGSAPLANCIVRSAQAAIRPEMRSPCYGASGRCGTDDLALLSKRSIKLHPDFQANAAVPIDGDVATGSRLLRTHCIPDQPTALRREARKLGCARLPSDDCKGHTIELVELDCGGRQWTLPYVKMASAVTLRRTRI